jgi:hypothetical protein
VKATFTGPVDCEGHLHDTGDGNGTDTIGDTRSSPLNKTVRRSRFDFDHGVSSAPDVAFPQLNRSALGRTRTCDLEIRAERLSLSPVGDQM